MKDEDKTKDQLVAEVVALRELNKFLLVSTTQHQQALEKELIEERQFAATILDTADGLVSNFVAAVLDTNNALVVVFDSQGRIVSFNRTCELVTHYFFNEVKGKPAWDLFVRPEDVVTIKEMFTSVPNGKVVSEYESDWITKNGSRRRISWSNKLVRSPQGEVSHLVSIGIDITSRIEAELELHQYKQHLEELVEQRTAELTQINQQLQTEIAFRQRVEVGLQQQTERERLIGAIAQRILGSLSLEEILHTAVEQVRSFLNVERVAIYQLEPRHDGRFVVESVLPTISPVLGTYLHDPCFNREYVLKYQDGRVSAIDDVWTARIHPCYTNFLTRIGVRANLVVPIVANNKLWGLLCAHQCSAPRYWQHWESDLLVSLATQLAIAIMQAELYQQLNLANIELQRLASSDGLTKVANRRYFDEYLNSQWQRLAREQAPLSLILCDIDFFKTYNDTYGHVEGDRCLQQVALSISRAVKRPADVVARYGGEEFAVILPNTGFQGAFHVAELIRTSVKALNIAHPNYPQSLYLTISLGISSIVPSRNLEPGTLIREADQALYQAKALGRDRVCFHQACVIN